MSVFSTSSSLYQNDVLSSIFTSSLYMGRASFDDYSACVCLTGDWLKCLTSDAVGSWERTVHTAPPLRISAIDADPNHFARTLIGLRYRSGSRLIRPGSSTSSLHHPPARTTPSARPMTNTIQTPHIARHPIASSNTRSPSSASAPPHPLAILHLLLVDYRSHARANRAPRYHMQHLPGPHGQSAVAAAQRRCRPLHLLVLP
ncbi:hypothetical protein B0H10DRAFT_805741 [Mycena sp. CBHHK59/15]|nr:hypothetical protein B0H10DRAFT_805741 [Mycena sp. CBHHK59/15]